MRKIRREAESFIACHGLSGHVVFTGPVSTFEHKRSIYSSADLFVFPGLQQEGQPLVVLEAMASGLPVLFTNRGCLRDTVIEGECGIEVRCNDSYIWLIVFSGSSTILKRSNGWVGMPGNGSKGAIQVIDLFTILAICLRWHPVDRTLFLARQPRE